jgi:hypothetical protein
LCENIRVLNPSAAKKAGVMIASYLGHTPTDRLLKCGEEFFDIEAVDTRTTPTPKVAPVWTQAVQYGPVRDTIKDKQTPLGCRAATIQPRPHRPGDQISKPLQTTLHSDGVPPVDEIEQLQVRWFRTPW